MSSKKSFDGKTFPNAILPYWGAATGVVSCLGILFPTIHANLTACLLAIFMAALLAYCVIVLARKFGISNIVTLASTLFIAIVFLFILESSVPILKIPSTPNIAPKNSSSIPGSNPLKSNNSPPPKSVENQKFYRKKSSDLAIFGMEQLRQCKPENTPFNLNYTYLYDSSLYVGLINITSSGGKCSGTFREFAQSTINKSREWVCRGDFEYDNAKEIMSWNPVPSDSGQCQSQKSQSYKFSDFAERLG